MKITIESIPHETHRYPTVGDWQFDKTNSNLDVKVSKMSDWRYEFLVAVHELCEAGMCKHDKVSQQDIDKFDMEYEKNRNDDDDSEPGDDPKAPYRRQHFIATNIERTLADALGVDWKIYDEEVLSLP